MIPHDLHTHTTFSDGSHSVETTVRFAEAVGLEVVAITDHFTPKSRLQDEEGLFDRYLDEITRASSRELTYEGRNTFRGFSSIPLYVCQEVTLHYLLTKADLGGSWGDSPS